MTEPKELAKAYDPKEVEPRWADLWANQPFVADPKSPKPPFTIVIPPPNVTGNLHLGHALDNTIIDTLIRFKRMQGFEALYLPGTDHAGISTQVLVEKELKAEGKTRYDLGREEFLKRVWQFKEKNGGTILRQLRRIGASCDWSRERFTMDEGLSRAVRREFVEYYHSGLAYRGERIVNWDPAAQTVLSDLEVDVVPTKGKLYTLAYELEGGGEIQIATVRPETIFADVAVAVNPADERYQGLIGKQVRIPLTDRLVPVIADAEVLMDFGTGALKITPAHDPTDFEIGLRHGLPRPGVIDLNGHLTQDELVPEAFRGMERFKARRAVVEALEAAGLLRAAEDYNISLGHSERTKVPVEPMIMTQWFVRMKPVAEKVLAGLDRGEMRLVPPRWEKVNRDWLENIRDWAVGRQLWWGHQIPAWYDPEGNVYVPDRDNPDLDCDQDPRYAHLELRRDEDVFDTWFSSALWPFSTLGWPDQTDDLKKFYPTDVLVTGYDIIFFWVARMQMSGYEFMGQHPFHTVMLHGLYLDAKGQKMSKSKNNGIDPLELMDKYGADACRFAWDYLSTGGQDIRHDERRYEQGRNFANKLYNATRFVLMQSGAGGNTGDALPPLTGEGGINSLTLADKWMNSRLARGVAEITEAYEAFDLGRAARLIYELVWSEFCDWYLEATKPAIREGNAATMANLVSVLTDLLKLLHPMMPFITSELYEVVTGNKTHAELVEITGNPKYLESQLAYQNWPTADTLREQNNELRNVFLSEVRGRGIIADALTQDAVIEVKMGKLVGLKGTQALEQVAIQAKNYTRTAGYLFGQWFDKSIVENANDVQGINITLIQYWLEDGEIKFQIVREFSNQVDFREIPVGAIAIEREVLLSFQVMQESISATRNLRQELGISPALEIAVQLEGEGAGLVMENAELFKFLSKANPALGRPERALAQVTPSVSVYLQPEGDISGFLERQRKKLAELEKNIELTEKKLSNPGFVERADPAVVQSERERLGELKGQAEGIRENLERLG
ncbi:MAG: valine--tRNA ligase [Meiothermus sp.]|nr:valine--tRNA ligase [Meiothermus sp.]